MRKTHIYVDGFNLYYGALRGTPYRWLNIERLCRHMVPSNNVRRINYYTARIGGRPENPDQPIRQDTYLRALATLPLVRIKYGHYLSHPVFMRLADPPAHGSKFARVIRTEEKGSDVNIATHLVSDAYEDAFDVAVLITNDSDLREPVDLVRRRLGKSVGVINPHRHPSLALRRVASFIKTIRPGDLRTSQLPDTLTDAKGSFRKPAVW